MIFLFQKYKPQIGLFLFFAFSLLISVGLLWSNNEGGAVSKNVQKISFFQFKGMADRKPIKYAGLFPWFDQKTPELGKNLVFKKVKIAPNGNGIFSGMANPGNSVYLKDQEKKVGVAKSDPEGQWVAIVEKPLSSGSKTYSLHSQSPDGELKRASAQQLKIEIPEDKTLGAQIKILEAGQKPIILAKNLVIPETAGSVAAVTSTMMAAAKAAQKTKQKIAVLKTEYQDAPEGAGTIEISGTSEKNASLAIFLNGDEISTTKADNKGNWKISESYAIKPGSTNNVRVEQRGKDNKVIVSGASAYNHVDTRTEDEKKADDAKNAGGEAAGPEKKEKTFWQQITGLFGSSDGDAKKADKDGAAEGAGDLAKANNQVENKQNVDGGKEGQDAAENEAEKSGLMSDSNKVSEAEDARKKASKAALEAKKDIGSVDVAENNSKKAAASEASDFTNDTKTGAVKQRKDDSPFVNEDSRARAGNRAKSNSGRNVSQRKSRSARKRASKSSRRRASTRRSAKRANRKKSSRYKKKYSARAQKRRRIKRRRLSRSKYAARKRAKSRRIKRLRRRIALRKHRARRHRRNLKRRRFARRKARLKYYRRHKNVRRFKRRAANRRRAKRRFKVRRKRVARSRYRIRSIRRSRKVRVRRGDTLWDLARIKYGHGRHYRKIYRANKRRLANPNRLSPNQRLFLPA